MNPLVIIPARAGSKGVSGKNTKLLNGVPLIAYTIRSAMDTFDLKSICITTDSLAAINIAESMGVNVPFVRPAHLATDTSSSRDVIIHALEYYSNLKIDVIVLLQPTSPFRTSLQIKEALNLFEPALDMVVSVCETKLNPYFNLFEQSENGLLIRSKEGNYTRRQDCPKVYAYNGAIYIINVNSIINHDFHDFSQIKPYIMDDISSTDIDSYLDWEWAEFLINNGKFKL